MNAIALAAAIRSGAMTAEAAVRGVLTDIARRDPALNAFALVDPDRALAEARALDVELRAGHVRGPLHGVPIAYKDLFVLAGLSTSCGTTIPDYFRSDECDVAVRLRTEGLVTIGKLKMTELAMGTFGENYAQGTPRNPWDAARIPGGSSSGSAVAIAAGLIPLAVGSDTGGSIRIPAACCGIWGLKPTYDRVSRRGAMPLAPSLDHVGPMARTPDDLTVLFTAMTGDRGAAASGRDDRPVVAVALEGYFDGCHPDVVTGIQDALRVFARSGAIVERLQFDPGPLSDATTVIARHEAALEHGSTLRKWPGALQAFTRARLEHGLAIEHVEYREALATVARLRGEIIGTVFVRADVLVAPIIPEPPLVLAEATAGTPAEVQARMARFSRFARLFNGLGVPTLTVPCGISSTGLPIAFQMAGRPGDDLRLLAIGSRWAAYAPPAPTPPGLPANGT
jgi:aspartyl-tRNA(Asn)/glutamyl-tRNA(Gln) amidotransferase subunit A